LIGSGAQVKIGTLGAWRVERNEQLGKILRGRGRRTLNDPD